MGTIPADKAFAIVGIGAAAGGYESFTRFLETLSADTGMAFILVQHLDPRHESKLTELLSRATRMPVVETKQAAATSNRANEPAQQSGPLAKIYSILRSGTGVDFTYYKQTTLMRRIQRRMGIHRIDRLEDFARYLDPHPSEIGALFDDPLITVIRFFRDPQSFRVLARKVFPTLIMNRRLGLPIRIWVPACSSGEEVYSIAISLVEFLGDRAVDYPIQIFGTDISETAIAKARAGVYRKNIALDVSPERLRRFFTATDDEDYRVVKSVREACVFARQDLTTDPPFSKLDLISCQNLMIYFGPELQKRVIPIFHYAPKDNKIDGAVLALFDIEEFKRSLEHFSELMWSPFLALDHGLRVVRANAAFYDMFLTTREETEGRFIYDLGNGQWNIPRLRVLLEEMLPNNTLIKDFPVAHEFPKIGACKMLLNARLLNADERRKRMILLAFQNERPGDKN